MDPSNIPASQQRPVQEPTQKIIVPDDTPPVVAKPEEPKNLQQTGSASKEFGPSSAASMAPSESGGQVEADDDEDEIKVARQEVMLGQKVSPAQEVPVSQELKEFGVEQGADTEQEIPVVVQRAGMRVTSTDSAVPVSAQPSVKLPITYAHALQLDKRSKIKESIKWLARFIKRQWERVQLSEKQKEIKPEEGIL